MPEEVMIIALVSLIFGTGLIGLVSYGIYNLIMAKINKGKGSSGEINPQFFKALSEFKKNTERRLANVEAIVSDLEEEKYLLSDDGKTNDIEIEDEQVRSESKKDKEEGGNLRNMLNE